MHNLRENVNIEMNTSYMCTIKKSRTVTDLQKLQ